MIWWYARLGKKLDTKTSNLGLSMKILNFYRLARQSFALRHFLWEAVKNSLSWFFSTADKLRGRTKSARADQPRERAITYLLVGTSLGKTENVLRIKKVYVDLVLPIWFSLFFRFSVAPETVIIPIICSIIVFPIVVATLICLLRHYNRRARAKDKFRYEINPRPE